MSGQPTITVVKRRWWLRRTDWVLLALLVLCAVTVVVGLVARAGLSPATRPENYNVYEPYQLALGFPCVLVGAYIAVRAPRLPLGWLFVTAGLGVWLTPLTSAVFDRDWVHSELVGRPLLFVGFAGWVWCRGVLLVLVPMSYPRGGLFRGASVWRKVWSTVAMFVVVFAGVCNALPFAALKLDTNTPAAWTEPFQRWLEPTMRALFVCGLLATVDLLLRVARMPQADRRRHAPFAVGAVLLLLPTSISVAGMAGFDVTLDSPWSEFAPSSVLPLALAVGVLRHGVLGFRTVVRRAALYGGVTMVAAGLYVVVVAVFAAALDNGVGAGPIVATGLVAVTLQPVRARVQQSLDRWVFGDRDEPYRALSRLSRRLGVGEGDGPLAVVAEAVRASLQLPAVAIEWRDADGMPVVAAHAVGSRAAGSEWREPVVYDGREIATLIVSLPEGEAALAVPEQRLVRDLAGMAGAVVQSALYAGEIARSRDHLVRAREEERRRLRHDLHDGLGPTLASVAMGLDAAATKLADDADLAGLLRDLDRALQDAIADIRLLVQGLRPPALDDLGLVPALREQAHDLSARSHRADGGSLQIEVVTEPALPPMGAAVEVAAFRIAVEGMTNVLRHAAASRCTVRLTAESADEGSRPGEFLQVRVEDDGRGIDLDGRTGVGFESMRNRAEELGGELRVAHRPGGGTVLAALLPLQHGEWAVP
jgi:two-component system, NarL family, sensor kinase